jgi:hypothetical protein
MRLRSRLRPPSAGFFLLGIIKRRVDRAYSLSSRRFLGNPQAGVVLLQCLLSGDPTRTSWWTEETYGIGVSLTSPMSLRCAALQGSIVVVGMEN